jgi:hypothetical protein
MGLTDLAATDNGADGDMLVAYKTSLGQTGTLQSLSFYVTTAAGELRLGVYDATGPDGGPGTLQAQTNAFTPVPGWNTQPVATQVSLPAGTYWLAYNPSNGNLGFKTNFTWTGVDSFYTPHAFGPFPSAFPTGQFIGAGSWSFYATLTTVSAMSNQAQVAAAGATGDPLEAMKQSLLAALAALQR